MAKQTTPLQNLKYVETVLKDVQAVLKKMQEDKDSVSFEQRGKLSGCLDELWHALGTIQDDEVGLRGKIERLMAIEQRVEPLNAHSWTRYRGSLLQCLKKAADTYYYTTQEDQGGHDWRVWATGLKQRDTDVFRPYELLERIAADQDQAALPAILDYDTSWFGYSLHRDEEADSLWVHAHLYIVGDNHPVAYIYRIDFEEEEDQEEELLGNDIESIEQHIQEINERERESED